MKRREAIAHQLTVLMTKAERRFKHDGKVHLPQVIVTAVEDGWMAWREGAFDRAETLIAVTEFLIARQAQKFRADPKQWLQRQQEIAAP